jgi:sugar transferase (PEP-CTERM/EpsH1 system associated)
MRILVFTPALPFPLMWGFNIRVFNLVKRLAKQNQVSLLCYASGEDEAPAREALGAICEAVFTVPKLERSTLQMRRQQATAAIGPRSFHLHRFFSARMQSRLSQILRDGRYDLIQVESSAMASFDFGRTPVVLDEHNLEYELLQRKSTVESSPLRRIFSALESRKVEKEEVSIWREVSGCLLTSERERRLVNRTVGDLPTAVVPNGVDLEYFRPTASEVKPDSIVFTGLMTYWPNADGVSYFIRDIFPAIRESRPDAVFTAVGWGLPDELRPLLGNGVVHTGRVDDVRPYLASASVAVVPLRTGSGTRLKILEALAMGKAVVSTSVGCEGLDLEDGEHLLIADDSKPFVDSVVRLLRNPIEAAALGARGRAVAERLYGWDQSAAELERFHQSLFARPSHLASASGDR